MLAEELLGAQEERPRFWHTGPSASKAEEPTPSVPRGKIMASNLEQNFFGCLNMFESSFNLHFCIISHHFREIMTDTIPKESTIARLKGHPLLHCAALRGNF